MNCVFHLNGWPAAGKLTVAKALQARIGGRLLHNHLFLNFVAGVVPRGDPARSQLIETIYEGMRTALAHSQDSHLIFTNALVCDYKIDWKRYEIVKALADDLNWHFVPVLLTCERAVLHERLNNPDRVARGKLADVEAFERIWAQHPEFIDEPDHPNHLVVDTTHQSAEDAAIKIATHMNILLSADRG